MLWLMPPAFPRWLLLLIGLFRTRWGPIWVDELYLWLRQPDPQMWNILLRNKMKHRLEFFFFHNHSYQRWILVEKRQNIDCLGFFNGDCKCNFIWSCMQRWQCPIYNAHRFSLLVKSLINLKTGSTLKCRNASGFDFTALNHLCFSEALYMYMCCVLRSNW